MREAELKTGERLDDLQCGGLYIIQRPESFCFGIDAVLLCGFAQIKESERVLDMCCGNGAIALLLCGKGKGKSFVGIELQRESAELAERSVYLNELEDKIRIINGDIRKIESYIKPYNEDFEAVVCNPPYMAAGAGFTNDKSTRTIARHEVECSLEDVFCAADKMLKYGGKLYMVHRAERLCDIMVMARRYRIEPKILQLVQTHTNKPPILVLMSFIKGGKPSVRVKEPLIIYGENGEYTPKIREIYYGR